MKRAALRLGSLAIASAAAGPVAAAEGAPLEQAPPEPQAIEKAAPQPVAVEPEYEMASYQWAFLLQAPGAGPPDEAENARLHQEHARYLSGLVETAEAVLAGPLSDGGEAWGVVVLDAGSIETAEAVLRQNPLVRAGRLVPEIHTWWAAKGILGKPAVFLDLVPCTLGLLRRPAEPPGFSESELLRIQAGHMENIKAMAETGELVIAGPMEGDGSLRGVFVFRGTDRAKIREMAGRDPAIEKGRLELVLHELMLPRGTLPPRKEAAEPAD